MLKSSMEGVDVWKHLTSIPGGERTFDSADLKVAEKVAPGDPQKAAREYEDMFVGMGYPTVWQELKNRMDMAQEMESKVLSFEEKKSTRKGSRSQIPKWQRHIPA